MLGQIFDLTMKEFRHASSGQSVIAKLFFYGFICKKKKKKKKKKNKDFALHRSQCKSQILQDYLALK